MEDSRLRGEVVKKCQFPLCDKEAEFRWWATHDEIDRLACGKHLRSFAEAHGCKRWLRLKGAADGAD